MIFLHQLSPVVHKICGFDFNSQINIDNLALRVNTYNAIFANIRTLLYAVLTISYTHLNISVLREHYEMTVWWLRLMMIDKSFEFLISHDGVSEGSWWRILWHFD